MSWWDDATTWVSDAYDGASEWVSDTYDDLVGDEDENPTQASATSKKTPTITESSDGGWWDDIGESFSGWASDLGVDFWNDEDEKKFNSTQITTRDQTANAKTVQQPTQATRKDNYGNTVTSSMVGGAQKQGLINGVSNQTLLIAGGVLALVLLMRK